MDSLGITLKKAREFSKFTLRQVEESIGISNAYLSQLENDKIKKPSASVLYKLANLYKVELNTLLTASGIVDKATEKKKSESLEFEKRVAFYSDNLTQQQREQVLEYVRFISTQKKDG